MSGSILHLLILSVEFIAFSKIDGQTGDDGSEVKHDQVSEDSG
jgi:hypothetical protein